MMALNSVEKRREIMTKPRYNKKRKKRDSRYKQGLYIPQNPDKYKEPLDETMSKVRGTATYRSSWELAFFKYCDSSDNIEYWGTESIAIKYQSPKDNKIHRYFPDVFIKMKSGEKHIIEIKPKSQFNNPINQAKWEAAKNYCSRIGAVFTVVSEVELKKWKLI